MIREVITYPNKLLRLKSEDVKQFDSELHTLLDDMYDTMMHQGGVGLAAIQIAIPWHLPEYWFRNNRRNTLHHQRLEYRKHCHNHQYLW